LKHDDRQTWVIQVDVRRTNLIPSYQKTSRQQ